MPDIDLDTIARQEADLQFTTFDADTAWELGSLIRQRADAGRLPIAIEISRGDHVLFFCAMPGATPDNTDWIRRKRAVVARFCRSSLAMRLECDERGVSLHTRFSVDPKDYAAAGGGFPIMLKGTGCIGAAIVSGLPQVDDHALVVDCIRALLDRIGAPY